MASASSECQIPPWKKKFPFFYWFFFLKGPDSDGFAVDSVNKIREKCTKPDKVDLVVVVLCSDRGVSSRYSNTGKTFYLSETSINFLFFFLLVLTGKVVNPDDSRKPSYATNTVIKIACKLCEEPWIVIRWSSSMNTRKFRKSFRNYHGKCVSRA